ncbi:MAG: hypothetical protein H0U74_19475 [Bradymonadaceae bacterium]|nr:hypothetical protein [Lujinxingiaceae bacterium]
MIPTNNRRVLPESIQRALREFSELLSKPERDLLTDVESNPEQWAQRLRGLLDPLTSFAANMGAPLERQIRTDTYHELAKLIATEVPLEEQHVVEWIMWRIEDDQPMTRAQWERSVATNARLKPWHIVLHCSYQLEDRKQYWRVCQAYLRQGDAPIKALEARRQVTLEDLPQAVNEAFLFNKETEMKFAIL